MHLVQKGWLKLGDSPVTALTPSDRDRTVAIGFEDGSGALVNMTSRKRVARTDSSSNRRGRRQHGCDSRDRFGFA